VSDAILDLRVSQPLPTPIKKKRVLLVDNSHAKRDLRAEIMRKVGMDVDCAADITEARVWWRADLYDLVLINAQNEHGRRDKFCEDVRGATPSQQLAFLVGKPEYLANSPNLDAALPALDDDGPIVLEEVKAALADSATEAPSQVWGILEACRQISIVRAAADARTRAIRQRPAPPRDSETTKAQKSTAARILLEPTSEEMQ
jgi:CheY-like chemotaxis protein